MSGIGCESFVVLKPNTENSTLIYGQNTCHIPEGEALEIIYIPSNDNIDKLKCQFIEIDGMASFSTILRKAPGVWGANSGSNEKNVCIGITFVENEPQDGHLVSTDYVRLGLERSSTAEEAVDLIATLAMELGEPGESRDSAKCCFVLCDPNEAWLLNIVGNLWGAERITNGFKTIPNDLSVGTNVVKHSPDVQQKSQTLGLWAGNGDFNFGDIFSSNGAVKLNWPKGEPTAEGSFRVTDMFKVLRDQALKCNAIDSHVSVLSPNGVSCHWFTGTSNPNESVFKPFVFTPNVKISHLTEIPESETQTIIQKFHKNRKWELIGDLLNSLEGACVEEVETFLAEHSESNSELDELMKDCVEAEIKFYR